eukprot:4602954-Amphidinium_carterae.1
MQIAMTTGAQHCATYGVVTLEAMQVVPKGWDSRKIEEHEVNDHHRNRSYHIAISHAVKAARERRAGLR